jgi:ribokinase
MPLRRGPDLIILGQVTIDDVVPAWPGPWARQLGGSSLYAAAGARVWLDPSRIGVVARAGCDFPFDPVGVLHAAGIAHVNIRPIPERHLVEWLIYEPDGSRRSLPRNPELLHVGGEGAPGVQAYPGQLLAIAPADSDIPPEWLPAQGLHLCPQVGQRHPATLATLRDQVGWISVDPSPHYSRTLSVQELAMRLRGTDAFLPSVQEIGLLLLTSTPDALVRDLHRAGFPEVVLKRGEAPIMLCADGALAQVATVPIEAVDATGAGDAFCGAYSACRMLGHPPFEAAARAAATAARVVATQGVEAALSLTRD